MIFLENHQIIKGVWNVNIACQDFYSNILFKILFEPLDINNLLLL